MFQVNLNERESGIDWPMWFALLGLMVMGIAFIFSATSVNEAMAFWQRFHETSFGSFLRWLVRQYYFRQVVACAVGLGIAASICLVDYHKMARWSLVVYWLTIAMLVAVLIPGIGTWKSGARRWLDFGVMNFQPSEFAKLSFLMVMANFLSRPPEELRFPNVFWKALGMTLLPFILILREPDLGSALVLLPVGFVLMLVAGVPAVYLKRMLGAGTLLLALLVLDILFAPVRWRLPLEDYQRHRLLVYFGQDFAPPNATAAERRRARELQKEKSYNVEQALISVGSGGVTGKGWRQGTQNVLGFLPRGVAHNDFIFSVIAEESGFVGSVTAIGLYTVVLFSGIKIAGEARDRLGRLIAIGIVALLFSHVFINIGMNIRLMPVTGIPLPLLSYGGTSVLCTLIAAGILQNISIYRRFY